MPCYGVGMFTGLVQSVGRVAGLRLAPAGAELAIAVEGWPSPDALPLSLGESIAVSGCCLTLAGVSNDGTLPRTLRFDVIHQTLRVTALGGLQPGDRVNLERSATPMTLLGGHIVQGHVDGLGRVLAILRDGGEWRVRIAPGDGLLRYLHDKGSVCIDGVSLTVAAISDRERFFDVCLIPETLARTTLVDRQVGDAVQLEVDCLAKMVARMMDRQLSSPASSSAP